MLDSVMSKRGRPKHPDILTPREWEVLALLREGLSNDEIAQRLGISLAGAKYHVSEILGKLGVASRQDAARWEPSERPWWAGAAAPMAWMWKKAHISWLATGAAAIVAVLVVAGGALLVWGLVRTSGDEEGTPLVVLQELQHLLFTPEETIAADGPGIFYIDIETGAAEGWFVPGGETFEFSIAGISSDGSLVLYSCQKQSPEGLTPCGGPNPGTWYLLNTETGERTQLPLVMEYRSLSPDGRTLLGETADGLALASVSTPSDVRPLGVGPGSATWSPDSASIIVRSAGGTYLAHADSADTVQLLPESVRNIAWAPNSSRVALMLPPEESTSTDSSSGIFVFDEDGNQLWSGPTAGDVPNPRWSADGEHLAVQVRIEYEPEPELGPTFFRLDVFTGDTGEPLYRMPGAIACTGPIWTADGSRLVVGSYGFGSFVVDPGTNTFQRLEVGATPSLTNAEVGVGYNGFDFYSVDLSTGKATLLAETTVEPAWFGDHEPLFVNDRIVFTAPHGGHGGCSVCCAPETPPQPTLEYPPFDD
ncbi:MAG: hypothetical protein J4N98_09555 [Chloroflexi bacterium]|nr:hypothetical protein [Chloroflexota bacterium]